MTTWLARPGTVALALLGVIIAACVTAGRADRAAEAEARHAERGRILREHEARALAIACRRCNGEPGSCCCIRDCGRRGCAWATRTDAEFTAELQALLRKETGRDG